MWGVRMQLRVCVYAHVCACWCSYKGVALERRFYLVSHGCPCDGRAGPAVALGIRISLCISWDLMWKHHWGREVWGAGSE